MLHRVSGRRRVPARLQLAQLRYVCGLDARRPRAWPRTTWGSSMSDDATSRRRRPPLRRGCASVARCWATSTSIGRRRGDRASTRRSSSSSPRRRGDRSGRRRDLDRRTRSLITIAILAALGRHEELALHLRATRNTGATPSEIREALLHVAVYAGVPAANSALRSRRPCSRRTPGRERSRHPTETPSQ